MKPTQEPTEIDYIKVAVIIDCEANIEINGKPGRQYQLQITVASTNPRLTAWCRARFGGAIYPQFYKKKPPNTAATDRWRMQSYAAAELLTKCLPHFIIKRPQAEIGIRFQDTYSVPYQRASEQVKLLREELRKQLLALTAPGPKPIAQEAVKVPVKRQNQGNLFAKEISN
jgi:hypothetical protein